MVFFTFSWAIGLSLVAFGLVIGAIAPTFGIGGGLLAVPILILVYSLDGNTATATSLGVIIFTSMSGTLAYLREKRIDFRIALSFMVFAIPGAISGAFLAKFLKDEEIEVDVFQIVFAITMLLISIYKIVTIIINKRKNSNQHNEEIIEKSSNDDKPWWKQYNLFRHFSDKRGVEFRYEAKLLPGILIATIGAFLGAMLGLGGGVIYVPILTMALGVPVAIAAATSTLTIFAITPISVLIRRASILWDYVFCIALGTIITSNIVPKFLYKIKSKSILTGFWILAMGAAIRLLIKVLTGIDV